MDERQYLIQEIELFCNQSGIAESTFGRQTVNDGKFVGRLRDGKGVTTATVAKVRRYLLDHGGKLHAGRSPEKKMVFFPQYRRNLLTRIKLDVLNFASMTIDKNICCSSIHAVKSGRWRNEWAWNLPTLIPNLPHFVCLMLAWEMVPF